MPDQAPNIEFVAEAPAANDVIKRYIDSALRWHPAQDGRGDNGLSQQETSDLLCKRMFAEINKPSVGPQLEGVANEDLYKIANDLDGQFKSAAGEIESLRLALISMLDADGEQLKGMAQRILDRSRERWPPAHKPFTSIAILEDLDCADLSDGLPHLNRNE